MKEKLNAWLDKPWTNSTYIKLCSWTLLMAIPCYMIAICCYLFPEKVLAFIEKINRFFKPHMETETENEPK